MENNTKTCSIDEQNPHILADAYEVSYEQGKKVTVKLN